MNEIEKPLPPDKSKRPDKQLASYEKSFFRYSVVKTKLNTFVNNKETKKMLIDSVSLMNRLSYGAYHFINILFLDLHQRQIPFPKLDQNFFYQVCGISSKLGGKWTPPQNMEWLNAFQKYKQTVEKSHFPISDRSKSCFLVTNLSLMMKIATVNHLNLNFPKRFSKYLRAFHGLKDRAKTEYIIDHVFGKELDKNHPCKFDSDQGVQALIYFYRKKLKFPDLETLITDNLEIFIPFYLKMLAFFEKHEMKKFTLLPLKGKIIPSHIKIDHTSLVEMINKTKNRKRDDLISNLENKINKFKKQLSSLLGKENLQKRKEIRKEMKSWKEKLSQKPKKSSKHELEDKRSVWKKYFKYDRLETRSHWFDWKITTNGYDVSIYYRIPKSFFPFSYTEWDEMSLTNKITWCQTYFENQKKKKDEESKRKDKKRTEEEERIDEGVIIPDWSDWEYFLGLDPGKRALFTTMDHEGNSTQCKRREYRFLTGFSQKEKKINQKKDQNSLNQYIQKYSFKVSKLDDYLENLKRMMEVFPSLEEEYQRDFYRKMKFTCYQKKIKTFQLLQERLLGGHDRVVIGFGNGSVNGPKIRGNHMPVKGFRDSCKRNHRIKEVGINEFLTSQKCSECREQTGNVYFQKLNEKTGKQSTYKVYGLRRCNNNECRITWDRDKNASRNILAILISIRDGEKRPEYLSKLSRKCSSQEQSPSQTTPLSSSE